MQRGAVIDDLWMRPLKHGYTNHTVGDGSVVEKTYEGPDAGLRCAREHTLLTRLRGNLPVPPVHGLDSRILTLGFVTGTPGQELMDAGRATHILKACGRHDLDKPDSAVADRQGLSSVVNSMSDKRPSPSWSASAIKPRRRSRLKSWPSTKVPMPT
jgi:hypothetical protein